MSTGRLGAGDTAIQPTIFDAKGDLLTATAGDTPARLAVGNNGETLVADSASSVGLRWQQPKTQNAVFNSAFDVWQRGTSVATGSGAAGSAYTADRWQSIMTSGAMTTSRQSVGDTTNLPNIRYCARVQRDSGSTNTNNVNLTQTLETADSLRFSGQTITLSFYARKGANYSSASDALSVQLYYGTGTDQNVIYTFTGSTAVINTTKTLTTTWQRFTATATVNAASTEIGWNFGYTPVGTAGAADYFEITGVQLEIGSVATPYSRMSGTLAGELAACQRYFVQLVDGNTQMIANASAYSASEVDAIITLPVPMRTYPSLVQTSGTDYFAFVRNGGTDNFNSLTISGTTWASGSTNINVYNATEIASTAGHGGFIRSNNALARLAASAEL